MATKMRAKYDKYWGDPEKMNVLIFIAMILDPRHKFRFVEFAVKRMYGEIVGHNLCVSKKDATYNMFKEYELLNSPQSTTSSSSRPSTRRSNSNVTMDVEHDNMKRDPLRLEYKKFKIDSGNVHAKTELDRYLGEATEEDDDDFDILK